MSRYLKAKIIILNYFLDYHCYFCVYVLMPF